MSLVLYPIKELQNIITEAIFYNSISMQYSADYKASETLHLAVR